MTPASFLAWRQRLRLSVRAAAKALGCSRNAIDRLEKGETTIPRYAELACMAIEAGMTVESPASPPAIASKAEL